MQDYLDKERLVPIDGVAFKPVGMRQGLRTGSRTVSA